MREVYWQPGGLFWRLTLSYILVTLVAALTVLFVVTLASTVQDFQQAGSSLDQTMAKSIVLHPETYLEQPSPDEDALRYWVAIPIFDALSKGQMNTSVVAVFDRNGQVISATACSTAQLLTSGTQKCSAQTANNVKILNQAEVQASISTVLESRDQTTENTHKLTNGDLLITQSVVGNKKQVVGVLAAVLAGPLPQGTNTENPLLLFISSLLTHLPSDGIFFLLLAIVLGTITGILISRNLTRRLYQIMQVTRDWSRGEFKTTLTDTSRDEVGLLARDLNSMAEQLRLLLISWQELAVVEERNRLARELHDSVKQHMFTNALLVRAARKVLPRDPQKAQQHLLEAEELSEQTQQEMVDLIQALRPAELVAKGLAPVVQDYLVAWSRRTGIAFDLNIQTKYPLRPAIEAALFRIFQEALANVARHSKAERIEVTLLCHNTFLSLSIQDNGTGFEVTSETEKTIGLQSMRERVGMFDGTLTINSSPQGTFLEARIPFYTNSY